MTNERELDELSKSIDTIISKGEFASSGDEGIDALARLATGLRGLPTPDFRARLSAELLPRSARPAWRPSLGGTEEAKGTAERRPQLFKGLIARARSFAVRPWLRRNRPFAAAGGSCGLLAGTCCFTGVLANVFGLASAATVSAFIDSTLPYFVAVSIASLAGWVALRVFREQGLTPQTVALAVRRYGLAMGSAYGAVFGASMGLAMAMGLY